MVLFPLVLVVGCVPDDERPADLDKVDESDILSYPDHFDLDVTEDAIVDRFGEPDEIEEVEISGTEVDGRSDIRRIYHYEGLEFIFYDAAREDFHILAATVLKSEQYAIDIGLRVGMGIDVARDVLGESDFVQDQSHVFSYDNGISERLNIELVVRDNVVTEIAVAPELP